MYQVKNRVNYTELDYQGIMSLNSIVNQFQNCSILHSESIGLGVEYLKAKQRAWILSSWQIGVEQPPRLGDEITVGTWATAFQGLYGIRNFIMKDSTGSRIAWANSVWIFMDLSAGRPVRPSQEEIDGYEILEPLPIEFAPRKIKIAGEGNEGQAFPVRRYHLDTNRHVNNGQYIQMAQESIPEQFKVGQVRAEYRKSAVFSNQVTPVVYAGQDQYTVSLNDENGKAYAVVQFIQGE